MSIRHNDKCSKQELLNFKNEVIKWLNDNFSIKEFKIKSYTCYNGDVRIYTGGHIEFTNRKTSFRRTKTKIENGKIIGYEGTRGHHSSQIAEYITINRDEFQAIKNSFEVKSGDDYEFNKDLIFDKLQVKH